MIDTVINEVKTTIFKRVPPGDRWESVIYADSGIFNSLTDALEFHYQKSNQTQFYISAKDGIVSVIDEVEVEPTITKYSLYGEY